MTSILKRDHALSRPPDDGHVRVLSAGVSNLLESIFPLLRRGRTGRRKKTGGSSHGPAQFLSRRTVTSPQTLRRDEPRRSTHRNSKDTRNNGHAATRRDC